MNKLPLTLLLTAGLMLTAGLARASDERSWMPPADARCVVSAGSGEVDYGTLSRAQLQEQPGHQLSFGKRSLTVSVTCPYSRTMKLSVQGDRSPDGQIRYGAQGMLKVRLSDAQLDGQPVLLTRLSASGAPIDSAADSVTVSADERVMATAGGASVKGRNLTLKVESEALLPDNATRVSAMERSEARLTLRLER